MNQLIKKEYFTWGIGVVICIVATTLCASGCAKQEIVKQDQMIPPSAQQTRAVTSTAAKTEASGAAVAEQPANEAQVHSQLPIDGAADSLRSKQDAIQLTSLEKIYFDFNSYKLSPAARGTLAKNAELLKQKGTINIRIEGNCDELGSDDYNLALGERRAKEAMKYLQAMGIPDVRLSVISYGKEKPVDPGHDEAARANNRRDEFVIIAK